MNWAYYHQDMPDDVEVTFGDVGAGILSHNLRCPICNEASATWWGNPVWLFAPCQACRDEYQGITFDEAVKAAERSRKKR